MIKLNEDQLDLLLDLSDTSGATVWGYVEAKTYREIQAIDPNLVRIYTLDEVTAITGEEFDGAKKLPYFGVSITTRGRAYIRLYFMRHRKEQLTHD